MEFWLKNHNSYLKLWCFALDFIFLFRLRSSTVKYSPNRPPIVVAINCHNGNLAETKDESESTVIIIIIDVK